MLGTAGRRWAAAGGILGALLLGHSSPCPAEDSPPEQGAQLHFRKSLSIHATRLGKAFAETQRPDRDDRLSRILAEDYDLAAEASLLTEVFRELNPGVDPEGLPAGREVRIPFKLEQELKGSEGSTSNTAAPRTHTVRQGESLWRILRQQVRVPKDQMVEAVAAVARANPAVKNWNLLHPGQKVLLPSDLVGREPPAHTEAQARETRSLLDLLEALGCRVLREGRLFLPLARGRSLRLEGREFPMITGLNGRRVILDVSQGIHPGSIRNIEETWGYTVLQGSDWSAATLLEKILPQMGFHELSGGVRRASLGAGLELLAAPRWTVVPRPEDLWEGGIHLIFPSGKPLDPRAAAVALRAGFSIHSLGTDRRVAGEAAFRAAELDMVDPAKGAGKLLDALGVPWKLRPEVSCDLGGGVTYRVRPELTFEHGGLAYAVPPREPARAPDLLERAGYVTVPWGADSPALQKLADLLSLLRVPHAHSAVEAPSGEEALKLRAVGVVVEQSRLAKALYPKLPVTAGAKVFLTEADLGTDGAMAYRREGFLPLLLRSR
jgi:hypothetical protein